MAKCAKNERQSSLFPHVGELWECEGRTAVIAGDSFDINSGRIWTMELNTGERGYSSPECLKERADRMSLTNDGLLRIFRKWANKGNSHAIWWLGWWFEGMNHQKSVWYYIAALRADPRAHGWAYGRIISDARSAIMCAGVARPDLTFLEDIPEIIGEGIGRDWALAIENAEKADALYPSVG